MEFRLPLPVRFADQFAQHFDAVGRDMGLRVGLVGHVERRFAREHQHAHRPGVVGHLDVGVDAVADHGDLVGLQPVAREDARKHVRIGFAQRDVGRRPVACSRQAQIEPQSTNTVG